MSLFQTQQALIPVLGQNLVKTNKRRPALANTFQRCFNRFW